MFSRSKTLLLLLPALLAFSAPQETLAAPKKGSLIQTHVKTAEDLEQERKEKKRLLVRLAIGGGIVVTVVTAFVFRKPIGNFLSKNFGSGNPDNDGGKPESSGKPRFKFGKFQDKGGIVPLFDSAAANDFDDQGFRIPGASRGSEQIFKVFTKNPSNMLGDFCGEKGKPVIFGFGATAKSFNQKGPYSFLSNYYSDSSAPIHAILSSASTNCPHAEGIYGMLCSLAAGADDSNASSCLKQDPNTSKSEKQKLLKNLPVDALATGKTRNIPLLATVLTKFLHPKMAQKLIDTRDTFLIEGNGWNDAGCGAKLVKSDSEPGGTVLTFQGDNRLGLTLMFVRELIKNNPYLKGTYDATSVCLLINSWNSDPNKKDSLSEHLKQHLPSTRRKS